MADTKTANTSSQSGQSPSQTCSLEYQGHSYKISPAETILNALVRGGANVGFSCKKGSCHTCLLKVTKGKPCFGDHHAIEKELIDKGYFLPCVTYATDDLEISDPDFSEMFFKAHVHEKTRLTKSVVKLVMMPEIELSWRAGQFVNVRHPNGAVRSYSIASVKEVDNCIELHVRCIANGTVSGWLADEVEAGEAIDIQGPTGTCTYDDAESRDRKLLLVGTGTGLSPLIGIVRDALYHGHVGPIVLYHGSGSHDGLYYEKELQALAVEHKNFRYLRFCSGSAADASILQGRAMDSAFQDFSDLKDWRIYLCGNPDMVYDARVEALRAGAERRDIHSDPFEFNKKFMPADSEKFRSIKPNPELWAALKQGDGLREIIEVFYDRVFEDSRLAPFFHDVTKQRAINKQYEFLSDLFTGGGYYFGLLPFNAHHWMVISDELFDYREDLFEECVRAYGIPDHLFWYWRSVHEAFRREIVKSETRGVIVDGIESNVDGFIEETTRMETLCDGCTEEIGIGETARIHKRTGGLYCPDCSARPI